jgi:phosphatidylglycerophosphate synthase
MKRDDFFGRWSQLHGGAEIKGVVRAWLTLSFGCCSFLKKLRITPNGLTYSSLLLAIVFLALIETHWAIPLLVLSLAADGLDGTLAIITEKVSKWGAALDAIVDRVVESIWALGLFLLGAPWQAVLVAWLAAYSQEYMRARAGGLGVQEVVVVTIAERPIRASVVFIVLVARVFNFDVAGIVAIIWAAAQVFAVVTVLVSLRPLLQQSQR